MAGNLPAGMSMAHAGFEGRGFARSHRPASVIHTASGDLTERP
jgi:hypothetical protein